MAFVLSLPAQWVRCGFVTLLSSIEWLPLQVMYHLESYEDVLQLFRNYAEAIAAKAQVLLLGGLEGLPYRCWEGLPRTSCLAGKPALGYMWSRRADGWGGGAACWRVPAALLPCA